MVELQCRTAFIIPIVYALTAFVRDRSGLHRLTIFVNDTGITSICPVPTGSTGHENLAATYTLPQRILAVYRRSKCLRVMLTEWRAKEAVFAITQHSMRRQ